MNYRFTNRSGGVSTGAFASRNLGFHVGDNPSDVAKNREQLSDELGPIAFMNQVHGDTVVIVETIGEFDPTADALVTSVSGITLAVQVADCIPLLLHSNESVAAVHVGRKGLVNGVALRAIEAMRELGSVNIGAVIGPSICGRCYEVSEDIFSEVTTLHPAAQSRSMQEKPALDLHAALVQVLQQEKIGVADESACTVESNDLFSYRRDSITGRQAGLISL